MRLPTLRSYLAAVACGALCGAGYAQVEITSSDTGEAYVEMTPEELRSLVGKVQRLRVQRAKQYAYLRQQREAAGEAPVASTRAGAPASDPRIGELDRDIDELSRQIALMREDMRQSALRQNAVVTPRVAEAPPAYRERDVRDLDARRDYDRRYADRLDDTDFRLRDDRARYDRDLRDERDRYDRDLRDERDRYRRLERDYDDLRRARTSAPAPAPAPAPNYNYGSPGLGFNSRLGAAPGTTYTVRDTVYVNREGERVVVRDTVVEVDTRVITRDVSDERVDLAAVLFAHNSTVITPAARLQIAQAVEAYRRQPTSQLLLRGFASKVGDVLYNQGLSTRRAESVRDQLVAAGVPATQIRMIGNGEDPTDNLASGRRVEIQLLPR